MSERFQAPGLLEAAGFEGGPPGDASPTPTGRILVQVARDDWRGIRECLDDERRT